MSSFLAATLATPAQPTRLDNDPSAKNVWTARLANLWIAIRFKYTFARYTLSRYTHVKEWRSIAAEFSAPPLHGAAID